MKLKKNLLRESRKKEGISQKDLAEKMDVSRQTIISIETGKYIPSLPLAIKVSKFFNKNVREIFEI